MHNEYFGMNTFGNEGKSRLLLQATACFYRQAALFEEYRRLHNCKSLLVEAILTKTLMGLKRFMN